MKDFESLSNLVVLEQFTISLPRRVAAYINERRVATAVEAAGFADEYVLIHKIRPGYGMREPVVRKDRGARSPLCVRGFSAASSRRGPDSGVDVCHYCRGSGHWKAECPALGDGRPADGAWWVKPAALAACVGDPGDTYLQFVTEGFVSLVGGDTRVPVRILRDTGASNLYIWASILPFSEVTDTGDRLLMQGMGMSVLPVTVHRMSLMCGLVQGDGAIGVRPLLGGYHFGQRLGGQSRLGEWYHLSCRLESA